MSGIAPTCNRIEGEVFMVLAYDGANSAEPRDAHLEEHLIYVEQNYQRYLVCGPMRNPGETDLMGSFFLVRGKNEEEVREILSGDPYFKCGMYEEVRVHACSPAGGDLMGGVIWESVESVRARLYES